MPGKLTMVGEEEAEVGNSFVFLGEQIECLDCKYRTICLDLEKGARYTITAVRPPVHDCWLTEGKARVVEVERTERTACVDKKYAIDGSLITFFPSECGQVGCEHYTQCNPTGIDNGDKVKLGIVCGKAECLIGQNRRIVTIQ